MNSPYWFEIWVVCEFAAVGAHRLRGRKLPEAEEK